MARQDEMINQKVDKYIITRMIAKGGMGRVYVAQDTSLDRQVALKIITPESDHAAEEMMMRFAREAKAIAQLDSHPNIINVYGYGTQEDFHYIAMQYVEGQSLGEYTRDLNGAGRLIDQEEMIQILRQVAAALDFAHSKGVIHRDVKPGNVMLSPDPDKPGQMRAILMDFGLVLRNDNTQTTGTAFGTPRYIAPEQALSSADAAAQSDIYSLGIMVFEMLTGRPPFEDDDNAIGIALSHVTKTPPSPRDFRPDLPETIVPVIAKVLEKDPGRRYQKASEFITAVEQALKPPPSLNLGRAVTRDLSNAAATAIHTGEPDTKDGITAPVPAKVIPPSEHQKAAVPYWLPALGLLLLLVGLLAFGLLASGGGEEVAEDAPATEEATTAPSSGSGEGRLELYYTQNWMLLRNPNEVALDLRDLEFRQGSNRFNVDGFGDGLLRDWGPGQCGYTILRGEDFEDDTCPNDRLHEPIIANNTNAFIWREGEFEVWQGDSRLATCQADEGSCRVEKVRLAR